MLISVDFETSGEGRQGGLEMYRHSSFVRSCAFAWRNVQGDMITRYVSDPEIIKRDLQLIADSQTPLLVYNMGFEGMVFLAKYGILPVIHADVMRLVQVYDNSDMVQSFGLKDATKRILGSEFAGFEAPIYRWIACNIPEFRTKLEKKASLAVKKGETVESAITAFVSTPANKKAMAPFLTQAPSAILSQYNITDAVNTLLIYEKITAAFEKEGYDWTFDHGLYLHSGWEIVKSKIRGVIVDAERIKLCLNSAQDAISETEQLFLAKHAKEIEALGLTGHFNINSTAQLKALFCDVMKMKPIHMSASGKAPSFSEEHLSQFGPGGEMLAGRRTHQLILNQAKNLEGMAQYDGRAHLDLKLAGTLTGRYAGGRSV